MQAKAIIIHKLRAGIQPIHIKVYRGNKKYVHKPTNLSIEPEHFDHKMCRVKSYHPMAIDMNIIIANEENKHNTNIVSAKSGTFNNKIKLKDYWSDYILEITREMSVTHISKLNSVVNKFELFYPGALLSEVDYSFLKSYKAWCFKRGNSVNTITKNMEQLRAIIRVAMNDKKYSSEKYPFDKFKLKTEETNIERLTEEETAIFESAELTNYYERMARFTYFMSYYNGGVRWGDICRLKWEDVSESEITFTPNKTKKSLAEKTVYISPPVRKLLDEIKTEYKTKKYIFPFLERNAWVSESEAIDIIDSANTMINTYLKKVSKRLKFKIGTKISIHKARHAFTDKAENENIDPFTLMALLGHKKLSTTMRYKNKFNKKKTGTAIKTMFGTDVAENQH